MATWRKFITVELTNASLLFSQLESTKNITERRQLRAELRTLKDKKEKMTDENGNDTQAPTMASKFTMAVGSSEKESYKERTNRINREESPARKENVAPQQPRNTRSTFSYKMANKDENPPENRPSESNSWKHQTNHVKSNIEEKRPRKYQDANNNSNKEKEKEVEPPKRMSRRTSLAELFKIDHESLQKSREQDAPSPAPPPQLTVSPSPVLQRVPRETHQDTKTKQDLLQNLGRLRCRRRSVREIERKEELDGLMYVKSGDTVKLVNTSEGDEQAKEQRKVRRTSRKESHEKLIIEGNTISNSSETELTPIQESPRSPDAKRFGFDNEDNQPQRRFDTPPKREEPPKVNRIWQPPPPREANTGTGRASRQWSDPSPQRVGPPRGPPRPNSFLPQNEVSCIAIYSK